MAKRLVPRTNTFIHLAIVLVIIYVGLPTYLHFFTSTNATSNATQPKPESTNATISQEIKSISPVVTSAFHVAFVSTQALFAGSLACFRMIWTMMKHTGGLMSAIMAPLASILHPFILFLQVIAHLFLVNPFLLLKTCGELLYPIYVFSVIALLSGLLLGGMGRLVAVGMLGSVSSPTTRKAHIRRIRGSQSSW